MDILDEKGKIISNTAGSGKGGHIYSYNRFKTFKQKEGHCKRCDILLRRHPGKDGYCNECCIDLNI